MSKRKIRSTHRFQFRIWLESFEYLYAKCTGPGSTSINRLLNNIVHGWIEQDKKEPKK